MSEHARDALRPGRLSEFGGQPDVSRELSIVLGAARGRKELPDHVLLAGPPGLGKTTLASIIATELGLPLVPTSGPAIERPGDMATILSTLGRPAVLFVDEIHRLPRSAEEILYSAMEDGVLDLTIGEGPAARPVRLPLVPFVLVGATTQAGLLSAPLRDRFGFTARLRLYEPEALAAIVARSAALLEMELTDDAALVVAGRSRGTPRIANKWLRRVRDWSETGGAETGAPSPGDGPVVVGAELAAAALEAFGVDALGLDHLGREILTSLCVQFRGGPVGLNTLAAAVDEAPTTLGEVYEPYMMRRGLLARTPRGRVATVAAFEHLGISPPATAALAAPALQLDFDEAGTAEDTPAA